MRLSTESRNQHKSGKKPRGLILREEDRHFTRKRPIHLHLDVLPAQPGQLRHIGIGRTHAGTHITLLIQDLDVIIANATTGDVLRELTIDQNRDYQPTVELDDPIHKKQ